MNIKLLTMLIAFLFCYAYQANAQSLITQLPKDGTWARYEYWVDHTPNGEGRQRVAGQCVIKSVGKEVADGVNYRWIEIEFTMNWHKVKKPTIYRMLVKEDAIVKGQDPRMHMKQLMSSSLQPAGVHVSDYKKSKQRVPIVEYMLPPPMPNKRALKKRQFKTPLGELECSGVSGSIMNDLDLKGDAQLTYAAYESKKSPFGTVQLNVTHNMITDGTVEYTNVYNFQLKETGTGATSGFPAIEK